ncbi:hypothetical protein [Medusavirus stheno T3]|uniref:Uncharacterized protein n=1 Tax=Medusavirus stheno T3 TaxID=3069717 RepID=A0A7S7YEW7_9VIRU|nr:hypothetical protein QKU73_gp244 [Acanthamoeba castellanii medusavirus]QPB44531.1 hypothetical protein [Medusavirus stheno T3]
MQHDNLPTPTFDAILDREGWSDDTKRAFYALCIGRLMNPRDLWSIAPLLQGADDTAAGFIARCIFPRIASFIYTVPRPNAGGVSLAEAHDSDLVVVRSGTPTFSQDELLAMIHKEMLNVRRMHAETNEIKWRKPVVLVGNAFPAWLQSRNGHDVFTFHFSRPMEDNDVDISSEAHAIFSKGLGCYFELVDDVGDGDVRDALPACLP